MQNIWSEGGNWDQLVSKVIQEQWKNFRHALVKINEIEIPRWIKYKPGQAIELHGFSDASEKAYGAVVYSRVWEDNGEITTSLLIAKTKVAPRRQKTTLPLLSKLLKLAKESLNIDNVTVNAWTDSNIVLAWIKGDTEKWKTFVSNRVGTIRRNTDPNYWFHVKSSENPADSASRGIDPTHLYKNKLWWNGPEWLKRPEIAKGQTNFATEIESKKSKPSILSCVTTQEKENIISNFSTIDKTIRIIAFCQRFMENVRSKKESRQTGILRLQELRKAEETLIKILQYQHFYGEISRIMRKKSVKSDSSLLPLNPVLDSKGILRVGGRLENSELSFERKHPIILPYRSHITDLIIDRSHQMTGHAGTSSTLANTRFKYWIVKGQSAVKQRLRRCVLCYRHAAKGMEQIMGNLPAPRVGITKAFTNTGLDYAGPISLRMSKGRGIKTMKGYFVIFICLATKAIHIEVVTDLSAQTFLAAYKRFTGRRGKVANLYSDNATYFVLASKILGLNSKRQQDDFKSEIISGLAKEQTQWHFIPPASPHFGGLWESGVKSIKYHLKRIVGETTLTYEELSTVLIQIEACLNSRPLCPLTDDIDNLSVLTPGHFLTGDALLAPPQEDSCNNNIKILNRWQLTQQLTQTFWKKWSTEYLSRLQQRPKWQALKNNVRIGSIVLIKDEQLPPCKWAIARIEEVHPGMDQKIRVASLKLGNGKTTKRPITKICPLPITDNDPEPESKVPSANRQINANMTTATTRLSGKRKLQPINQAWQSDATEERIKKYARVKAAPIRPLMLSLIVLLVLPIARASVTIINPGTGLYVEKIGFTNIKRGTFRIELNTSVADLNKNRENVNQTITQIEQLCNEINNLKHIQCEGLTHHLREEQKHLDNMLEIITTSKGLRQKRGLLGKLMQTIFGVNDEVYTNINQLNQNQQHLLQIATQQSSLMLSTLSRANETESRVTRKLNQFNEKLNKSIEAINSMTNWYASIDENKLTLNFLLAYTAAESFLSEIKEKTHNILDIFHDRGSIQELLSFVEINQAISEAKVKLPSSLEIITKPIPKTEFYHDKQSIVVYGFFDIIELQNFTLVHLTSIPVHVKENTYAAITLQTPLLAINYNDQNYFELSETELDMCNKQDKFLYFCTPSAVKKIDSSPNCVIDEIYHRHNPSKCDTQQFKIDTNIFKSLVMPNSWMFIANKPFTAGLQCNGIREDILLNNTGIINIEPNCVLQTSQITLKTRINSKYSVLATYHKGVNITFEPRTQKAVKPIEAEEILTTSDQFFQHARHNELELQQNLALQRTQTIAIGTSTSGVILGIISIIAIWYGYKRIKYRRTPVPTPRHNIEAYIINSELSTLDETKAGQNVQEQN